MFNPSERFIRQLDLALYHEPGRPTRVVNSGALWSVLIGIDGFWTPIYDCDDPREANNFRNQYEGCSAIIPTIALCA